MNEETDSFDFDCSILSSTVHEQKGGTCYAHAAATVLASIERRIEGRVSKDHSTMVSEITEKYGFNGKDVDKVLEVECKKRQLILEKIKTTEEAKYWIKKKHALAAAFTLEGNQWQNLGQFLKREPQNILTMEHLLEPNTCSNGKGRSSHAVVIGGYDEKEKCWIIKNSWGKKSGYYGYWKVSAENGLPLNYFHVYASIENLSDVEIFNYIVKYGSTKEIHSELCRRGKIEEFQVRFFALIYQSLTEKTYSIFKSFVNYIGNFVVSLRN